MKRDCSIPDCGKPVHGRGWCEAHWVRWRRHGDPLGGGTPQGEPAKFYREIVLTCERGPADECLIWPYARLSGGYAELGQTNVSRLVCEERHGPAPTPVHQAAHSCGNGHLACVTKGHLDWKTPLQNKADELIHGTRQRGERINTAKLTEPEVREILSLRGRASQEVIAEWFGVGRTAIGKIHRKESWAWL